MSLSASEYLKIKRVQANRKRPQRRRPRPPRQAFPKAIQAEYGRSLTALVNVIEEAVGEILIPHLESLVAEAAILRPDARTDDWNDSLDRMMEALNGRLDKEFGVAEALAIDIGQKTSKWHDKQWQKILRSVLGTEVFQREPWLSESLNAFAKDNVALIKSIKDDSVREIEGITRRSIQGGIRHEEIRKQIEGRYPISRNRAKLIARDQVAKLNGNLTMLRQKNIGVSKYIWRTSGDRRVRPEHAAREGDTFSWDDPPSDGHPGQPVQCVPGDSKLDMIFDGEIFFRRWYAGPLTTLIADSGEFIHATPNHPILTLDGWKPIQFVNKGDYLIKKTVNQSRIQNINHSEATIAQIFNAFSEIFSLMRSPGASSQFHGDGTDQEVNIIRANGFLPNMRNTMFDQKSLKFFLAKANLTSADNFLSGSGNIGFNFLTTWPTPDSIMSSFCKFLALLWCKSRHSQKICLATIARLNPIFQKACADRIPRRLILFGNGQFTHTRKIIPNNFLYWQIFAIMCRAMFANSSINPPSAERLSDSVSIDSQFSRDFLKQCSFTYSSCRVIKNFSRDLAIHVYNLQTKKGWYLYQDKNFQIKNQGFILKNCRCTAEAIFEDVLPEE